MDKKITIVTSIYSDLYGTKFGGRPSRGGHYRWSLLSLLKMTDSNFVCYTSDREIESLKTFFFEENHVSESQLQIKEYDLENHFYKELFDSYKDYDAARRSDRCMEVQWMKFKWLEMEDMTSDYYYWMDSGLSHCGLIPDKHLTSGGPHNRSYYESPLFNNNFLSNLISETGEKVSIIGKENQRNYWSGTVDPKHFINYNNSVHIIGGLFGGKKELVSKIYNLFNYYGNKVVSEEKRLYHEEDIMTLMYRNHEELFNVFHFDTWWHEDERVPGLDILEHTKNNNSFYKILERLNKIYE